jgi:SAM-dependent methyltransferase
VRARAASRVEPLPALSADSSTDHWAEWLRLRRHGGSAEQRRLTLERLAPIRDELLDLGRVRPGDVVLDVGCGDGLIGLGALERSAHVIFSDVSQACLEDCRTVAGDAAEYRLASATDLGDVAADVVTMRSVLIYVDDKPKAFAEFFRVLRPGGRIAIFEPINRFGLEERRGTWGFGDVRGVEELLARVVAEVDRVQDAAGGLGPMIDFDERDLLALAEGAGFVDLRLQLIAEVTATPADVTLDWDVMVDSSPNPLAPTLREAMESALAPEEIERLTAVLRPQVEEGRMGPARFARAFLSARKPA